MSRPEAVQTADYIKAKAEFSPFLVLLGKKIIIIITASTDSIYDSTSRSGQHIWPQVFVHTIIIANTKQGSFSHLRGITAILAIKAFSHFPD